ncbi:GPI transamidase component PIG-T [Artemisia annua]|uniref:GPI transamidase component PIG-T n=1 Tax=Artemisia annua TaxID=35608 RepID=A0A2U1P9I8_ARTAN|nr:GPI transamidase component PIG-T [Artemisia annua]
MSHKDLYGDGHISNEELSRVLNQLVLEQEEDGDGHLSIDDLSRIMELASEEEDGDVRLSIEELSRPMELASEDARSTTIVIELPTKFHHNKKIWKLLLSAVLFAMYPSLAQVGQLKFTNKSPFETHVFFSNMGVVAYVIAMPAAVAFFCNGKLLRGFHQCIYISYLLHLHDPKMHLLLLGHSCTSLGGSYNGFFNHTAGTISFQGSYGGPIAGPGGSFIHASSSGGPGGPTTCHGGSTTGLAGLGGSTAVPGGSTIGLAGYQKWSLIYIMKCILHLLKSSGNSLSQNDGRNVHKYRIRELELSFTQGRWNYESWSGFEPVASSNTKPPGVELWDVFDVPADQAVCREKAGLSSLMDRPSIYGGFYHSQRLHLTCNEFDPVASAFSVKPFDLGFRRKLPVTWSCVKAPLRASRFLMGSGNEKGAIALSLQSTEWSQSRSPKG